MNPTAWHLALLALTMAHAASAQSLRSVVVPADATVVVAPRGAPATPHLPTAFVAVPVIRPEPAPLPAIAGGTGLAALAPALVPLAAALLLGATAPGSGGISSAPASTR